MAYESLHARLPELAEKETRTITVPPGNEYNLPPDEYGLLEMYCNDENCDCRRVFLNVFRRYAKMSVAYIAYGWEDINFYIRWYLDEDLSFDELSLFDKEDIINIKGPCLNISSPQSEIAPTVLKMVINQTLHDEEYIERLKRHYKLFRAEVDRFYNETDVDDVNTKPKSEAPKPEATGQQESVQPTVAERKVKNKAAIDAEIAQAKIPKAMVTRYTEIAGIIEDFCFEKLDGEFEELCLRALAKLCRKRPSPLVSGKAYTWACGIVYAIGSNNFIFDRSQPFYMPAAEIAQWFGLSKSTAGNKAAQINKLLDISYFNTDFLLKRYIADNPAIWYVSYNGYIVDIRNMPRELQEEAYRQGVIPYIQADQDE